MFVEALKRQNPALISAALRFLAAKGEVHRTAG